MSNVVRSVAGVVLLSTATWQQVPNGIVGPTDSVRIRADGLGFYGPNPTDGAWPEGSYLDRNPNHIYDVPGVHDYDGVTDLQFIAFGTSTKPASLVMCLRDIGVTPPSTANSVTDASTTTRDKEFDFPTAGGTKQLWLLFNDLAGNYANNSGQFSYQVDIFNDDATPPNINYGVPVGNRTVPNALWQAYQAQAQFMCWMWAIKPVGGAWEGYTSLDKNLSAPVYVSPNGLNEIPHLTYLSQRGVSLQSIATQLKIASDSNSTVVTVLNFDRDKLKAGYYDGALVEVFEVNWRGNLKDRTIVFAGQLGTAEVHDLDATIQLLGWEYLANQPIGHTVTALCTAVFCGAGCRVESINSGPVLSDYTRAGTIISVTTDMKFRVTVTGSEGGSGFFTHLAEGKVAWSSGANDGAKRDIKAGALVSGSDVDIFLHAASPYLPQVGDVVAVSMGCDKSFGGTLGCTFYANKINFQGMPWIPLREGVMRRG